MCMWSILFAPTSLTSRTSYLPAGPFPAFTLVCCCLWPTDFDQDPLCGCGLETVTGAWWLTDCYVTERSNWTSSRIHQLPVVQQGKVGLCEPFLSPRLAVDRLLFELPPALRSCRNGCATPRREHFTALYLISHSFCSRASEVVV